MKRTLLALFMVLPPLAIQAQTTINLTISQASLLEVTASNDVTISDIESTTLTATALGGTPAYKYKWLPLSGLSGSTTDQPEALPKNTTTYTVTVTDKNNCTATQQVTVTVTQHQSGTENTIDNGVQIYPNPVGASFYINFITQEPAVSVSLYTTDGKEIWNKTVESSLLAVTAFEAPKSKGMYLLNVISGQQVINKTIVVN